jgi:integrase/recombinase XerD
VQWGEALAAFARYQRAASLSEKTIANREEVFALLARRSGKGPLDTTEDDLLEVLGRMHARTGAPIAAGTKQSERSYYQTFFTWMQAKGHRPDNPAAGLPKVKIPRRKPRPLRLAQVDAMLDSGAYRRTRDIITIAALSGLRLGEIVKIRGGRRRHRWWSSTFRPQRQPRTQDRTNAGAARARSSLPSGRLVVSLSTLQ